MKTLLLTLGLALCGFLVLTAQEPVPPPKAKVVPETPAASPAVPPADPLAPSGPAVPPKAKVVPDTPAPAEPVEEESPAVEESPPMEEEPVEPPSQPEKPPPLPDGPDEVKIEPMEVRKATVVPDSPSPIPPVPNPPAEPEPLMPDDTEKKPGDSNPGGEKKVEEEKAEEKKDVVLKVRAVSAEEAGPAPTNPLPDHKPSIPISASNDKNARTLFLTIPAPRGQIVDRYGNPLAQNRMVYFLGLQFNLSANLSDAAVLAYAKPKVEYIGKRVPHGWAVKDEKILEHYKNRRWLPLLATRPIMSEATDETRNSLPAGVVLIPAYMRYYPNGKAASHLLGEMGKKGGMSSEAVKSGEPIWPLLEGKNGLEARFEQHLTGVPGKINLVFSATGEKISEEIVERPQPGATVVTSIDLEMQKIVERLLNERTRRGAMAIMDIHTGDMVAVASNPDYDPNLFAFGIREEDYLPLNTDEDKPLFSRATLGTYPPASTFKVLTALAALESGEISRDTQFDCVASMFIGNRWFDNWHKSGEGPMNVIGAIKRSCNTWFYRAAISIGATPVTSMATRFGLGEKSGLCVPESAGRVPTPEWWRTTRKATMTHGDLANVCIGQGDNLVTPVQCAMMMAGVARGHSVPYARLVQQIQDLDGNAIEFFPPQKRDLSLKPENVEAVHQGMRAVVASADGTGKAAWNPQVSIAGKTGTAQWYIDKKRGSWVHLAWFAGFVPAHDPQFAFAAVYEGNPGDGGISGGKRVAPLVGDVFEQIYIMRKKRGASLAGDPNAPTGSTQEVRKAKTVAKTSAPKAKPAPPAPEPTVEAAPQSERGLRWLWRKLKGQ